MSDVENAGTDRTMIFEYELDAPPQKVWRAVSRPDLRALWLPKEALAHPEATLLVPGQEARYTMRDSDPPFLESAVTFQLSPTAAGGTRLRIVHRLVDARLDRAPTAANGNRPTMMLAA
jgi:uncharacterized protein YndB with AHSA1/START domain